MEESIQLVLLRSLAGGVIGIIGGAGLGIIRGGSASYFARIVGLNTSAISFACFAPREIMGKIPVLKDNTLLCNATSGFIGGFCSMGLFSRHLGGSLKGGTMLALAGIFMDRGMLGFTYWKENKRIEIINTQDQMWHPNRIQEKQLFKEK
jgi:hypothetical protein